MTNISINDLNILNKNPIINISFNQTFMSYKLIHISLLHKNFSAMKEICCHHTLTELPKTSLRRSIKNHAQYVLYQKFQLPLKS